MRTGYIYRFYCIVNNRFIVGSSVSDKREGEYFRLLKANKWNNKYVQLVFNKYGEENHNSFDGREGVEWAKEIIG